MVSQALDDLGLVTDSMTQEAAGQFFAAKAADSTTTTNTTLAADSELVLGAGSATSAVFELSGVIFATGPDTGDIKLAFTGPTGATLTWYAAGAQTAVASGAGAATINIASNVIGTGGSRIIGLSGTSFTQAINIRGLYRVSTTAGNLTLNWAQGTSDAGTTTLKADSFLTLRRLS